LVSLESERERYYSLLSKLTSKWHGENAPCSYLITFSSQRRERAVYDLDTGSFSKEAECNLSPLLPLCMQGGVFLIVRATMHACTGARDLVMVIRSRFVNCKRNRDWRKTNRFFYRLADMKLC
jgi:hypothetical protein